MERVIQPDFEDFFQKDHPLKGKWREEVFGNDHPLVLELGCGKGEYTLGLARRYPGKNFLGVDIKGARIWKGATQSREEGLLNVAFLRTRIEFISSFFAPGEVDELWITFPDPQQKKRRRKKRLTGAPFLDRYRAFLVDGGRIHLKTDNRSLYLFTRDLARFNGLELERWSEDLYQDGWDDEAVQIRTYYEQQFLEEGKPIHFLQFRLRSGTPIQDLPDELE